MPTTSRHISRKAGASLLHSPRTAEAIGRPLNTYVTISLWQLGLTSADASRFFQDIREKHFQRWSSYTPRRATGPRNGKPTYAWVIEAPDGLAHVHWMLHVQPGQEAAFAKMLHKCVSARTGKSTTQGSMMIEPLPHPEGLKLYLGKGLEPRLARLWDIRPEDCGDVDGRRAGNSRNLGPAEWKPRKAAYKRQQRQRRAA